MQNDTRHGKVDDQASHVNQRGDKWGQALAGSKLRRRMMRGSIEPLMVPHRTTPTRLHATVMATSVVPIEGDARRPEQDPQQTDQAEEWRPAPFQRQTHGASSPPVTQPHLAQGQRTTRVEASRLSCHHC